MSLFSTALRRSGIAPRAYFAGAQTGRLLDDFWSQLLSIDYAIRGDLRLLRDRARQLAADNPHVAGFIAGLKTDVLGWEPIGIQVQAQVLQPDGRRWRDLNRRIEQAFLAWGEDPLMCSADGRHTLGEIERLALGLIVQDGEFLARKLEGFDNPFGFAVQVLDPDLLDERLSRPAGEGANEIRMGVEVNGYGRPVAYHLLQRHPADLNAAGAARQHTRVPAEQILHRFLSFRPGQTRGIPLLTPVLLTQKMLDGYLEAHLVQARAAAATGGFFVATGDDAAAYTQSLPNPLSTGGATDKKALTLPIQAGVMRQLPPGLDFKPWDPKAPNSNAPDFVAMSLRMIARGVGAAYTTYSGDGREMSYGTLRGMTIQERDGFRAIQRFLGVGITSPIYRAWFRMAALTGALRLPTEDASAYLAHRLQYRGWQWIDPANDLQATEGKVALGIGTRTAACADQGLDFEDTVDQLAEEEAYALEKGVAISGLTTRDQVQATADNNQRDQAASDAQVSGRARLRLAGGTA